MTHSITDGMNPLKGENVDTNYIFRCPGLFQTTLKHVYIKITITHNNNNNNKNTSTVCVWKIIDKQ